MKTFDGDDVAKQEQRRGEQAGGDRSQAAVESLPDVFGVRNTEPDQHRLAARPQNHFADFEQTVIRGQNVHVDAREHSTAANLHSTTLEIASASARGHTNRRRSHPFQSDRANESLKLKTNS